jgi:hypothetical protein
MEYQISPLSIVAFSNLRALQWGNRALVIEGESIFIVIVKLS